MAVLNVVGAKLAKGDFNNAQFATFIEGQEPILVLDGGYRFHITFPDGGFSLDDLSGILIEDDENDYEEGVESVRIFDITATDSDGTTVTQSIILVDTSATENAQYWVFGVDLAGGEIYPLPELMKADGSGPLVFDVPFEDARNGIDVTIADSFVFTQGNSAPEFIGPDAFSVDENTFEVGAVVADDADGDTITYSLAPVDDFEALTIDPSSGFLSFREAPDFEDRDASEPSKEYTVTVVASDGTATSLIAVNITVNDVNEDPVAADDSYTIDEDSTLTTLGSVLDNDTDVDATDTPAINGTAVLLTAPDPAHVTSFELFSDGTFDIAPAENFFGEISFTYQVIDTDGASATATATITVNPVNDAPTAVDDGSLTDFETAVLIDVLGNDADVDGPALSIGQVLPGADTNGSVEIVDGQLRYTPDDGFVGTAVFEYTVTDGTLADTGEVTVEVAGPGPREISVAPLQVPERDSGTTEAMLVLTRSGDLRATDSVFVYNRGGSAAEGTDFASLSIEVTFAPGAASVSVPVGIIGDTLAEGDESFTIGLALNSEYDDLSFGPGVDFDGEEHFIGVAILDDDPEAVDDDAATDFQTAIDIDVLANDTDNEGGGLTLASVTPGPDTNGDVEIVDGQLRYTPADGFAGTAVFGYTLQDASGTQDSGAVTVTVAPPGARSVAIADVSLAEGDAGSATIAILTLTRTGDLRAVDSVRVTSSDGSATVAGGDYLALDEVVTFAAGEATAFVGVTITGDDAVEPDETLTVSLAPSGSPFPDLTLSAPATVTILNDDEVIIINQPPTAVDDSYDTGFGDELVVTAAQGVLANDSDSDGPDSLVVVDYGQGSKGSVVVQADGSFVYTPDAGASGEDSFTYVVSDGEDSDEAVVTITIEANSAPVFASAASFSVEENSVSVGTVLATDADGDTVTYALAGSDADLFMLDADTGEVSFKDAPDFEDPGGVAEDNSYSFEIIASDGFDETVQTVTVNVTDLDDLPPNPVDGTSANGEILTGTDGRDIITAGGGVNDYMTGGGGADIFVFTPDTGNGRDTAWVADYEVGLDQIDIGGASVLFNYSFANSTYLFLGGGDFDLLVVNGASAIDDITFV